MASSVLRESPGILLLAHRNTSKSRVGDKAQALGLNYLRSEVGNVRVYSVLDLVQPRYVMFKACLPQFAFASYFNTNCYSFGGTYGVDYGTVGKDIIPFTPPPLILCWGNDIPTETLEKVRNTLTVTEGVSGGHPALEWRPSNWEDINKIKTLKSNILATAPVNFVNIKAFISARALLSVLTAHVHAMRYPAFQDSEHKSSFALGKLLEGIDVDNLDKLMDTDDFKKEGFELASAPGAFRDLKYQAVPLWKIDYTGLPSPLTHIKLDDANAKIPPGDGLWFPYFSFLHNFDTDVVPWYIRDYAVRNFGDEIDDCLSVVNEVCGDWGMIGKTEFGKEISHFVKVFRLGLDSQARVIPCFRKSHYEGSIMLGTGYTISLEEKLYRPVTESELRSFIVKSDVHSIALDFIAGKMGNAEQTANVKACDSMLKLRNTLLASWTKEKDKTDIVNMAAFLNFHEDKWPINLTTLQRALNAISDPDFSLGTAKPKEYPIHSSRVLCTDTNEVVWSCFGTYAPSFRIPGGRLFHLSEDMTFEVVSSRGKKDTKQIVRIAVRAKELDDAVDDLAKMLEEKSIENPVVMPRVRVSQENMDKIFAGDSGRELLGSLRSCVGISNSGKKRKNDDLGAQEAGSSKKQRKGVLDLSGW
jgi:hypothetical protein